MKAHASLTTACARRARSPFGSQRLQARKPAASAWPGDWKADVLAKRPGGWTAGAAENADCGDGVEESPLPPGEDRLPERLGRHPIDDEIVVHADNLGCSKVIRHPGIAPVLVHAEDVSKAPSNAWIAFVGAICGLVTRGSAPWS